MFEGSSSSRIKKSKMVFLDIKNIIYAVGKIIIFGQLRVYYNLCNAQTTVELGKRYNCVCCLLVCENVFENLMLLMLFL